LWHQRPCTFFGLNNHLVSQCWKINSLYRKVMETRKKSRIEDRSPYIEKSKGKRPLKEKGYCSQCSRDGHHEATCWAFHPNLHPKRNNKTRKTPPRETTNQAVSQGNPPPEKGQLNKGHMFIIMTGRMGKILELIKSVHDCKSHVVIQTT
jgi:hypothetical protein